METTKVILNELHASLLKQYKDMLDGMGPMMKPKVKGILVDGYTDGLRTGIHHTVKMLGVTVKE